MKTLAQAILDYKDTFNECYPVDITGTVDDKELIQDIYKCIKSNRKKSIITVIDDPDITGDPETIIL